MQEAVDVIRELSAGLGRVRLRTQGAERVTRAVAAVHAQYQALHAHQELVRLEARDGTEQAPGRSIRR